MSTKAEIDRASKLYQDFRERPPRRARRVEVTFPRAVMVMGRVDAVDYTTTHAGKVVRYRHDFAAGSKPLLCAGPDKNQLYLMEGRYHVTERGIVDLDARGREIDDGGGHRTINPKARKKPAPSKARRR